MAADNARTRRIATDVLGELTEGRYPLVLTERREHLDAIAELLAAETDRVVVLHGGMGVRAQRRADDMLTSDGRKNGRHATGISERSRASCSRVRKRRSSNS